MMNQIKREHLIRFMKADKITKDIVESMINEAKNVAEIISEKKSEDKNKKSSRKDKKEGLSATQVRGLFTEIRRIEGLWQRGDKESAVLRTLMLQPRLKNRINKFLKNKKDFKAELDEFEQVMSELISISVESDKKFERLVAIIETIVAYLPLKAN